MMRSIKKNMSAILFAVLAAASVLPLTGCGGTKSTTTTTTTTTTTATTATTTATASSIILSATPITVKSDNSTPATFTLTTVDASNAAVAGVTVTLSTDTGLLNKSSVTTDATGVATFTFQAGGADRSNRTATITATAGTVTKQYPIQISGSTATATASASSLSASGTPTATLTVTAKDSAGTAIPNVPVVLTQAGAGTVTFTPVSGVTDTSGLFTSTVAGSVAGSAVVTATTLGATSTSNFTVSPSATTLSIASSSLNGAAAITNPVQVAMKIGDTLAITVNAAGATQVRFVSTLGTWNTQTLTPSATVVNVVGGTATATLTTTQAGIATIYVDNPAATNANASMTVAMTATTATAVTLQATPSLVSKSVGTTKGVSTLIATVTDANGNPVGDAPVSFSILNPTGGGESISPALAFSAANTTGTLGLGQAKASFTAGTSSSGQKGVQVRAQVLGTTIATQPSTANPRTASGNDASIVIGGTAGSIAFGSATVLTENSNKTAYIQSMSVLVADSNGNPAPAGTVVNLSVWPIAWSTGKACAFDTDAATTGTFYNEDANENLFLDATEDGVRKYYATGLAAAGVGTKDGLITPVNSAGGTAPGTVTTDATGVATFDLTYGKNSALWTVTRIRARTIVQGSEAMSEIQFRLSALVSDVGAGAACKLPDSPYKF